MNHFHAISAQGDDPATVIKDCLQKIEDVPPGSNLGFIYVSDVLAESFEEILQKCKFNTGIKKWAGSLGVGLITTNEEIYDRPAISLLLCDFPEDQFEVIRTIKSSDDIEANLKLPEDSLSHFALMHVDAYNPDSQNLMDQVEESTENCFIVGGITSSRSSQYQVANEVSADGISGVIFSDKIGVLTNLTQGCTPLGEKHLVTNNEDNIVYSLDDRPALDVFYDDIGEMLSRNIERSSDFVFVAKCIPNSDVNDYKVRNLLGIDEEKKIFAINDHLSSGDRLLICKRDGESATQDLSDMLLRLKSRLTTPIKGGIYISCVGRGREQFGHESQEVRMIHENLGDFPLAGFFANGEIHNKHIYGYTGVLTLFT